MKANLINLTVFSELSHSSPSCSAADEAFNTLLSSQTRDDLLMSALRAMMMPLATEAEPRDLCAQASIDFIDLLNKVIIINSFDFTRMKF